MKASPVHDPAAAPQWPGRFLAFGRQLPRRTIPVALAATGLGAGLFFGWGRLAAAGLSSAIVGLLPCAAMCAAGLCAGRSGGQGGRHGGSGPANPPVAPADGASARNPPKRWHVPSSASSAPGNETDA